MARPLRIDYPGAYYHITARGVGHQDIFFADADRLVFLEKLAAAVKRWNLRIHGYCLMTNHFHLEVETPDGNLSRSMQWLNQMYAGHVNRTYGRVGHLFQGRFKSALIESGTHLHLLTRYIHLNPVRAKMAGHPASYKWSSYGVYLGLRKCPQWLETSKTLERFGDSLKEQRRRYREFVEDGLAENPLQEMVFGAILGTKGFVESMRKIIKNKGTAQNEREVSSLIFARPRPGLEEICEIISRVHGVSKEDLSVKGRKGNEVRGMAIFLSRECSNNALLEIGSYFGEIGAPAVSLACSRVAKHMNTDKRFKKRMIQLKVKVENAAVE